MQKLKEVVWGSATILPRPEWAKQGVTFHPYDQMFAYGLKTPKNGTHNFLMCLQVRGFLVFRCQIKSGKAPPG